MIHLSQITIKPKTLEYWRKPTKEDIKFGLGTLFYRDFIFEKWFDENGYLKLKVKTNDDKLIYYYTGNEKQKYSIIQKINSWFIYLNYTKTMRQIYLKRRKRGVQD